MVEKVSGSFLGTVPTYCVTSSMSAHRSGLYLSVLAMSSQNDIGADHVLIGI